MPNEFNQNNNTFKPENSEIQTDSAPDDSGMGRWVWTVIILIVLIAIGLWLWKSPAPESETSAITEEDLGSDETSDIAEQVENINVDNVDEAFQGIDEDLEEL